MTDSSNVDLQSAVAAVADRTRAHAGAPALLLQAQAALGQLAEATDLVTESGRRPFRTPPGWSRLLAQLSFVVYQLADQTGTAADDALREMLARTTQPADNQASTGRHGAGADRGDIHWQESDVAELGPEGDSAGWL